MKRIIVSMMVAASALAACGGGGQPPAGSGGNGGVGGGAGAGPGSMPTPWTAGIEQCYEGAVYVAADLGQYTSFVQFLMPTGRNVKEIGIGVARDLASASYGGPYPLFWATGPAAGTPGQRTWPTAPRLSGMLTVAESDIAFVHNGGAMGVAKASVAPLKLLDDEGLWVGIDMDSNATTAAVICTNPFTGGEDTYATTGVCPGTVCATAPGGGEVTEALWAYAKGD